MKISGRVVKYVDVEITLEQQKEITAALIRKVFSLPDDCHINSKGELVQVEEQYGGSHRWDKDTILRTATATDRLAVFVLKQIRYFNENT